MKREKELFKNTLVLTIGNTLTKLITFFLLPLYTYVLSTEEFGIVDLLNTLVALLLPIITFQIEQAVFRELIDNRTNDDKKREIISTSFFIICIQCIGYAVLCLILQLFIHNNYMIFMLINVLLYVFASLFQQIARGYGNNTVYAISSFISALVTILFNIVLLIVFNLGAYGMLIGTALGQLACIIYIFFKLNLHSYIKYKNYDKNLLFKLWKYSIPLIPNSISWWVFNASDRVIISIFLGLGMNGILAASHKFSSVFITFYNVFHLSWLESISLHIKDSDINIFYNKMVNTVMSLFLSIDLIIISAMPFVYSIMIDQKYYDGYFQVPIIMLGSFINVLVALETAIYVANKNTKSIAYTSVVSAIINIIIHLCLVNYIGLFAATISTLIAYLILFVYRYIDIKKKYFKIEFDKKIIYSALLIFTVIMVCYYSNNMLLKLMSLLLVCLYSCIINRKSVRIIIGFVKKKIRGKAVI